VTAFVRYWINRSEELPVSHSSVGDRGLARWWQTISLMTASSVCCQYAIKSACVGKLPSERIIKVRTLLGTGTPSATLLQVRELTRA